MEEQAAGALSEASKRIYAETMPLCEQGTDFTPLTTIFRAVE